MPGVQERSVSRPQDAFELAGKTVEVVARYVEQSLRATELEPEWVIVANHFKNMNEAVYGPKRWSGWPVSDEHRRRSSVSNERGRSEGWWIALVVDDVWLHDGGAADHWRTQPLICIEMLSRSHGWAVAAVVSNLLDIA